MKRIFQLFFLAVIFSSCSPQLRPFTDRMYINSDFSERELKKIQFYVSRDIVLSRQLDGTKARLQSGKIRIVEGASYEEIVIRRGTRGVFAFSVEDGNIAVSFEGNPQTSYLVFGPSERRGGEYVLRAAKWERDFGVINYNGQQYTTPASSAYASLMVDVRGSGRSSSYTRRASGKRVR